MQARWLERKRALRASHAAGRALRHAQAMTQRAESGAENGAEGGANFDDESLAIERNR
jgi:hypothetical protein